MKTDHFSVIASLMNMGRAYEAEQLIAREVVNQISLVEDEQITYGELHDRLVPLHDFATRHFAEFTFSDWIQDALHEIDIYQTCLQIHHHTQGSCMDIRRMHELARNALH